MLELSWSDFKRVELGRMRSYDDVDTFVLSSILDLFIQEISHELRYDGEIRFLQLYKDKINHELRTPITCIQTAMELMKRNNGLSKKEKMTIYEIIEKNIQRLVKIIDTLFKV